LIHSRASSEDPEKVLQVKSRHFVKWTNANGVVSFILNTRVAPSQQSFYYTNPSFAANNRYLWFYAAYPPQRHRSLGVIDFGRDEVRHYPETAFDAASPLVDSETGDVYWVETPVSDSDHYRVFRRGPQAQDARVEIARIPHFGEGVLPPRQVATHLSFNANRTALGFDSGNYSPGNETYAGVVPLTGEEAQVWAVFGRRYNHALMNPVWPDVMLIAQDYYHDQSPGVSLNAGRISIDNRMWLLFADGQVLPIFPEPNKIYHEWWDASGKAVWYIDKQGNRGGVGTCRVHVDIDSRTVKTPILIWPNAVGHSHGSHTGTYLVGDHGYKSWEKTDSVRVSFYNSLSRTEVDIVTTMSFPEHPQYHTHPHPQFTQGDRYICYTTTVLGHTTLALCPVEQLIQSSRSLSENPPDRGTLLGMDFVG